MYMGSILQSDDKTSVNIACMFWYTLLCVVNKAISPGGVSPIYSPRVTFFVP